MSIEELEQTKTDSSAGCWQGLGCLLCIGLVVGSVTIHSPPMAFFAILVGAVVLISVPITSRMEKEQTSVSFLQLCKRHELDYKSELSSSQHDLHIATSRDSETVMVRCPGPAPSGQTIKINIRQILGVDLAVDERSIYETGSVLPGAVAGGLTFGGAGAIVGALATGGGRTREEIRSISLRLRMNDLNTPLVIINFLTSPTRWEMAQDQVGAAEKWTNLIEVLRHRLATSERGD